MHVKVATRANHKTDGVSTMSRHATLDRINYPECQSPAGCTHGRKWSERISVGRTVQATTDCAGEGGGERLLLELEILDPYSAEIYCFGWPFSHPDGPPLPFRGQHASLVQQSISMSSEPNFTISLFGSAPQHCSCQVFSRRPCWGKPLA